MCCTNNDSMSLIRIIYVVVWVLCTRFCAAGKVNTCVAQLLDITDEEKKTSAGVFHRAFS